MSSNGSRILGRKRRRSDAKAGGRSTECTKEATVSGAEHPIDAQKSLKSSAEDALALLESPQLDIGGWDGRGGRKRQRGQGHGIGIGIDTGHSSMSLGKDMGKDAGNPSHWALPCLAAAARAVLQGSRAPW